MVKIAWELNEKNGHVKVRVRVGRSGTLSMKFGSGDLGSRDYVTRILETNGWDRKLKKQEGLYEEVVAVLSKISGTHRKRTKAPAREKSEGAFETWGMVDGELSVLELLEGIIAADVEGGGAGLGECTCSQCQRARESLAVLAARGIEVREDGVVTRHKGKESVRGWPEIQLAIQETNQYREELRALILGDPDSPELETPSFAAVAQPQFAWKEHSDTTWLGVTEFPAVTAPGATPTAEITFPKGNSPWARAVKLHEMLHARFTPEVVLLRASGRLTAYSEMALQIAEDVRLAQIARERNLFRADTYFPDRAWKPVSGRARSQLEIGARYMAAYGQPLEGAWDSRSLVEYVRRSGVHMSAHTYRTLERWGRQAKRAMREPSPGEQFKALALASQTALRALREEQPPPPSPAKPDDAKPPPAGGNGDGSSQGQDKQPESKPSAPHGESNDGGEQAALEEAVATDRAVKDAGFNPKYLRELKLSAAVKKKAAASKARAMALNDGPQIGKAGGGSLLGGYKAHLWQPFGSRLEPSADIANNYSLDPSHKAPWGTLITQLAPLERNFRALVKRSGAAAPEGPLPRNMHRWFGDKQIFVRQGLRRGGTLLIDQSGSMQWSWESVRELIEATPAMTIAVYSSNGEFDGGFLTIIAKDGKLVGKDWTPGAFGHYGGNVVDGPALAWLARQARPRLWFSDGQVTGCADHQGSQVLQDARRLCRLGAIRRTVDPDKVRALFSGRPVAFSSAEQVGVPGD